MHTNGITKKLFEYCHDVADSLPYADCFNWIQPSSAPFITQIVLSVEF